VSDTKTASWIAALEQARAALEQALSADGHWRALREDVAPSGLTEHERALAANPVYRCWEQLNGAIEELRRRQTGPTSARRRVSLREVLEHIHSDAELSGAPPQPPESAVAQAKPARTEPADASAGLNVNVAPEPEEATVSFVIHEPARAAPVAGHGGEASVPEEPPPAEAPESDLGTEAEVTIVPRRR
jgi:hypothetical protein